MALTIRELQVLAHATATEKGWWENDDRSIGELLMLAVTELAEAMECYRKGEDLAVIHYGAGGEPEGYAVEIADVFIRLADQTFHLGIDLEEAIKIKMAYNERRQYRHGGKVC